MAAFVKRSSKRSSRAKTVNILKGGDQDFGSLLNSACTLGTNGALAGSHWILSLRWLVTGSGTHLWSVNFSGVVKSVQHQSVWEVKL